MTFISNIQKSLEEDPGWITDSVIENSISISKYNPLATKRIRPPNQKLINIKNIEDNE